MNAPNIKYLLIAEVGICSEYSYLEAIFDSTDTDYMIIAKRIIQTRRTLGCINSILWSSEIGKTLIMYI